MFAFESIFQRLLWLCNVSFRTWSCSFNLAGVCIFSACIIKIDFIGTHTHIKHLLPHFMALPIWIFGERKWKKNNKKNFGKHSMKHLIGFQLKTEKKKFETWTNFALLCYFLKHADSRKKISIDLNWCFQHCSISWRESRSQRKFKEKREREWEGTSFVWKKSNFMMI